MVIHILYNVDTPTVKTVNTLNQLTAESHENLPSSAASLAYSTSNASRSTSMSLACFNVVDGSGRSAVVVGGIFTFGSSTRASSFCRPSEFTLCTEVRCFWILDFSVKGSWQSGQASAVFGSTLEF